jgi:translocation protein SEC62
VQEIIEQEPLFGLAETLRAKNGVEARPAVLVDERVDIVRGKDLIRFFEANPHVAETFTSKNKPPEDRAKEVAELLLRKNILIRCERKFKKPPPGQARLTKFPRKLIPPATSYDRATFVRDSFYAWGYERPISMWSYIWAAVMVVVVLAACLFPLAPHWVRLAVVYLSAGLLSLILALILTRSVVAVVTWVGTGRTVWIMPNMLADDVPIKDLFNPYISVEERTPDHPLWKQLVARGLAVVGIVVVGAVLYSRGPDQAAVKKGASRIHDDVLDWLNLQRAGYGKLGNDNDNNKNDTLAKEESKNSSGGTEGLHTEKKASEMEEEEDEEDEVHDEL